MFNRLQQRLSTLKRIYKRRRWYKFALLAWGLIGFYAMVGDQFVPESLSKSWPRLYDVIAMTTGWLPWLAWLCIAAVGVAIAAVEYATRLHFIASPPNDRSRIESDQLSRMSFIAFKEMAEREYGWDFGPHSDQLIDLANGLRQAAMDKALDVEGRYDCAYASEDMSFHFPLRPIEDFVGWYIDPLSADNWNIRTQRFDDPHRAYYRDLHINNEKKARRWLAGEGQKYKSPQRTVDAEKALIHIAHHSSVGDRVRAKMEFEQAARAGRIRVWGRKDSPLFGLSGHLSKIKKDYWDFGEIDLGTFILYDGARAFASQYEHQNKTTKATRPRDGVRDLDRYLELEVNKEQILAMWPLSRKGSPLE